MIWGTSQWSVGRWGIADAFEQYEIYLTRDRIPDLNLDSPWAVAAANSREIALLGSFLFGADVDGRYFGFVVAVNEVGYGPRSPVFEAEIESSQFQVLPSPVSDLRASPLSGGRLDLRWKHDDTNPYIKPTDFEIDGEIVLDAGGTTAIHQVVTRENLKTEYRLILGPFADGAVTISVAARDESGISHPVAPVISVRTDATPPVATPLLASAI